MNYFTKVGKLLLIKPDSPAIQQHSNCSPLGSLPHTLKTKRSLQKYIFSISLFFISLPQLSFCLSLFLLTFIFLPTLFQLCLVYILGRVNLVFFLWILMSGCREKVTAPLIWRPRQWEELFNTWGLLLSPWHMKVWRWLLPEILYTVKIQHNQSYFKCTEKQLDIHIDINKAYCIVWHQTISYFYKRN